MSYTLVIGFGSELRGDDALGPIAARRIEAAAGGAARVIDCQSLTPDLAPDVADAASVIFIDCSATGPVGELCEHKVEPIDSKEASMVHFLDAPALLAWARTLYGRCPDAVMLTVPGQKFDICTELSAPVAAALGRVVNRALELIGVVSRA